MGAMYQGTVNFMPAYSDTDSKGNTIIILPSSAFPCHCGCREKFPVIMLSKDHFRRLLFFCQSEGNSAALQREEQPIVTEAM